MKKRAFPILFGALLLLSLCSCGGTPEEPTEVQVSEEEQMQQLLDTIDQTMSETYDGCSVSYNSGVVEVNVWAERITDAADAADGAKDPSWVSVKSDVEASVISTVNSIQSAGFSSRMISFHVLDDADHDRTLLTFDNGGVSYDIVAQTEKDRKEEELPPEETPEKTPEEPPAEETPSQPEQPSTPAPAPNPQPSQGGGGSNFNTHDNPDQQQTTASYVLNTSTMKFHFPNCRDVPRIAPENYSTSSESSGTLVSIGYSPCGHCNP